MKRDAFQIQRDVSRPRPWGQTEGGKGPLIKTQNAWEEGEESKQRAWFTGAAASLALSFTGDSIPGLSEWEDTEALGQPLWNLNTSSNIPQEPLLPHQVPLSPQKTKHSTYTQSNWLVVRIYHSTSQMARWNHWQTRQPHTAGQCRPSQAPTLLLGS